MNRILRAIHGKYRSYERARRLVAANGDEAVRQAKKAIFALHRDDRVLAEDLLGRTARTLSSCDASIRAFPDLRGEGPYAAGLEEYAEAQLFDGYVRHGRIVAIDRRTMEAPVFIAGLCDATGEIVRYAMRRASAGKRDEIGAALRTVEGVVTDLLDMDLTGYLRTKFDQAKRNLRTLEQMHYELSVRE